MTSFPQIPYAAALLVAALGFTAATPALAQAPAPATPDKAPPATQVAAASTLKPAELKPEQLLQAEPTAAGPRAPTRESVIEDLKRARGTRAMDWADMEINGPAH